MLPIHSIKYQCNSCQKPVSDIIVFAEQVDYVINAGKEKSLSLTDSLKMLVHGYKSCPHCNSENITISLGSRESPRVEAPTITYSGNKTFRQRVPDSFKEVLTNIRDKAPGGKGMKTSVL